jgi:DNA-binding transcriptional ArsR family regulator
MGLTKLVEQRCVTPASRSALAARARYFRVLGDPTRLRMLEVLLDGERTVQEIAGAVGAPRSRVSNHLACLKWCQFVAARRQGRHVLYRVADLRVGMLIAAAGTLSVERCEHLAGCRRIGPDWV